MTPTPAPAPAAATETAQVRVARLVADLHSQDPGVRERASVELGLLGPEAVPALEEELLRGEAGQARLRALLAELKPGARGADPRPGARQSGMGLKDRAPPPAAEPRERWWEEKFKDAVRRIERGDHLAAVRILDAILTLEPDCPIRDRVRQLRIRAKELQIRVTMLEARVVAKRVLLTPGEAVELQLELKNVSGEPLVLAPPDATQGELFGALEIETYDATALGERTRARETQRITSAIPARLEPSETWRAPLSLKPQRPPRPGIFRRVRISGSIRSQTLEKREERHDRFLPLFPVELFFVEEARHGFAAEPLRTLAEALQALREAKDGRAAAAEAERLFFAAMIAPEEERERVIALLAGALEREGDPAAHAAMTTLSVLTDRPLDMDREAWRLWLNSRAR